jgi:hypothetical protein
MARAGVGVDGPGWRLRPRGPADHRRQRRGGELRALAAAHREPAAFALRDGVRARPVRAAGGCGPLFHLSGQSAEAAPGGRRTGPEHRADRGAAARRGADGHLVPRRRAPARAGPEGGGAGAQDPCRRAAGDAQDRPAAGGAGRAAHLARDRRRRDGRRAVAAGQRARHAGVLRGQPRAVCGGRGLVHRRDAYTAGGEEHRARIARSVSQAQPRIHRARRPGPDHDRPAQRGRHGPAPGLDGHARHARPAPVRVQHRRVRHPGAPWAAHGRGCTPDGALSGREGAWQQGVERAAR